MNLLEMSDLTRRGRKRELFSYLDHSIGFVVHKAKKTTKIDLQDSGKGDFNMSYKQSERFQKLWKAYKAGRLPSIFSKFSKF